MDSGSILIDIRAFDGVSYSLNKNITVEYIPDSHVIHRNSNFLIIIIIMAIIAILITVIYMKKTVNDKDKLGKRD
jgi:hypothetical protein